MSLKKYKALSPDPYINKIKGDTELARLAHLNNLVDQINSNVVDSRPYKVYTALLTQTGINDPTAIILENTFDGEIVWTFDSNGVYIGTLTDAFTSNKTWLNITNSDAVYEGVLYSIDYNNVSQVYITTYDINTTSLTDSLLNNTSIEIRVYN
jgi:hypothetical protein